MAPGAAVTIGIGLIIGGSLFLGRACCMGEPCTSTLLFGARPSSLGRISSSRGGARSELPRTSLTAGRAGDVREGSGMFELNDAAKAAAMAAAAEQAKRVASESTVM